MTDYSLHRPTGETDVTARAPTARKASAFWLALGLCALAATLLQAPHAALPDVGWLFVAAEQMLAGAELYVEIVEVNPPMSVFLYVPAVLFEGATGFSLAATIIVLGIAASAMSVLFATQMLRRAGLIDGSWRWPLAAGIALLVLPLGAFGQREHFALIALLPYLAAIAARGTVKEGPEFRVRSAEAVIAGVCGALAMTIKPHFVLAGLLPALYGAWWRGSVRALFTPENWIAGILASAYVVLVIVRYPAFFEVWMPILQDTYRAHHVSFLQQLLHPGTLALAGMAVGVALALGRETLRPAPATIMLAGAGFALAAFEQGKMWNNHLYPALAAFALVVLAHGLRPVLCGSSRARTIAASGSFAAVLALVPALGVLVHRGATTIDLAPSIRSLQPDKPSLLAFSGSVAAANPLTAEVDGAWAGTPVGQWQYQMSDHLLKNADPKGEYRARLEAYKEADRQQAARDFASRPDFVLIDQATFDWHAWALQQPEIAAGLAGYVPVDHAAGVSLWARKDLIGRAGPNRLAPDLRGGIPASS